MTPVTLQEALPALNTQIGPLEELVFRENLQDYSVFARHPKEALEYKQALIRRCNFTNEVVDFIKELKLKYPDESELNSLFNRFSDCQRQLMNIYNKLEQNIQ